jgi:hypothetical protein
MSKLQLHELVVSSFETGPSVARDTVTDPNHPTPATFCRICPEYEGAGNEENAQEITQ